MATQEKLLKSLEVLKNLSSPNQTSDHSKKKDKIQHCHIVTEAISNSTIKIAPNFHTYLSITIEVLLQLCDDQESDIRMTAEECLNRIIRAMHDSNIGKVLIELHKGIKKNGPTRSLRACLWRFSQLAHLIRPHKGKPYAANLFPTIIKISERPEEQIHETLASSLSKIMKVLGSFTSDNETKALLRAFLKNVPSQSASIRRTTSSCVLSICLNCRKPYIFIVYVISYLLDLLVPVSENHNPSLILGTLTCLKSLLPHLKQLNGKQEIKGSFGVSKEADLVILSLDKLLQIYELCLFYFSSKDHNIVNAALETMNVLLQNCPSELHKALISPSGVTKSRITLAHTSSLSKIRSPSQLSVATNLTSDDLFAESELTETVRSDIERWIDESKLSVMNITYAKTSTMEKALSTESKSTDVSEMDSASYDYNKIGGYKSRSIDDNLEKLTISDKSSDKSGSCIDDDRFSEASLFQDICIGTYLDKDVPLIYCARLIAKSFLLTGQPGVTMPDKNIRISVKSLALTCLSSILKIHPKIFALYLDKDAGMGGKNGQQMSDVCLYSNHSDPQLRGAVRMLIAHFIRAVLVETDGQLGRWLDENESNIRVEDFIKMFIKGLEDESSNCSRQSIISLGIVLEALAESSGSSCIIPILNVLPRLALNPYWLVKVSLCELICKLPYVTLHDITGNGNFQNVILHNVLFELLQDSDLRVRNAAANAVVNVIPFLYHEQQCAVIRKALQHKNRHLSNLNNSTDAPRKRLVQNMPFPFNNILCKSCDNVEFSLSKIVSMLFNNLLTSSSKHFIHGCVETLALLCKTYPTTVYRKAWNCTRKSKNDNTESGEITLDLLSVCLGLLKSTVVSYDLNCHLNLLSLSSNLYAGTALCLLCPVQDTENTWSMFSDAKFAQFSKDFLSHTVKLLNIFHYVLDDLVPVQSHSKTMLPNLSAANPISPIKRRKSDVEKKILSPGKGAEKDDAAAKDKKEGVKATSAGAFIQSLHYMKIYEILRSSYTNYKISLDSEASEKLLELLKQTLRTLAVLLEVGSLTEFQGVAEEILGYFRSTFALEASGTVECVQQLLKCLFGTNLTSNLAEVREELGKSERASGGDGNASNSHSFYQNIFQTPYDEISDCFSALKTINKIECDGDATVMGYLHRKDKPLPSKSSDKVLASFIRIFEPMVIKSLKEYTITSNVRLQRRVLQLLSQLIQLRVNYCLLDSEQIFIGFVLKQFEYIEEGQVPFSDELVPKIFQFLVQLSYSKQHSRSIISIPKIIQLCDGLMASGQSPVTHCIPALAPIVEDIFLTRNKSNTLDIKELETTRDVVLAMLLRLSEYHQVVDLIVLILEDSKYCSDNSDKWLRWSTQVAGVLIPMLRQNKIKLDSPESFSSLRKLIFALNPNVFRPADAVILLLFQDPLIEDSSTVTYARWLSKILLALLILSPINEDALIGSISELKSDFAPGTIFENITTTIDPLNVTNSADYFHDVSSEMIFARFLFKTIGMVSKRCIEIAKNQDCDFLVEELSVLLMYCLHIFQSGSHGKIASYAVSNLNEIQLEAINHNFLQLSGHYPVLTFLWCYFLTLLNYNDKTFWSKIMCDGGIELSINAKVVRTGAVILFCDYMTEDVFESDQLSWFLSNCITVLVTWCDETPIFEFISSIHRHPAASKLLLDNIFQNCLGLNDSVFVMKILKCVENTHPCHTGLLLKLLLPNLLVSRQLAVSRLVANLASRKLELLLTMSMEDVNGQLAKEDLLETIKKLVKLKLERKHQALSSLLNKLCTQYYDISPLEFDQKRSINSEHIKKLQINKSWYLSQIKSKCGDVQLGDETAELLSRLEYDEILKIMGSPEFNTVIFKNCLALGGDSNTAVAKATVCCLLEAVEGVVKEIPEPHQVYNVREKTTFSEKISSIFKNDKSLTLIYDLIPSISYYVQSHSSIEPAENVFKFAVVCLESAQFLIDSDQTNVNVKLVDSALNCSSLIFKEKSMVSVDLEPIWLSSAVNSLYKLVEYFLLHDEPLPSLLQCGLSDVSENPTSQACYQLNVLLCWIGANKAKSIPEFLLKPLRSLTVALARMPLYNSYVIIPSKAWKSGWQPELCGSNRQIPPLPIEFLQEIDILEEFIYRVTLLGWTSRQQFEETWMSLLSVLCNSPGEDSDPAEINDIIHASTLAVKSITALLLQTLHDPVLGNTNVSKLIHVSRDSLAWDQSLCIQKLKKINASIERKYSDSTYLPPASNVFSRPNFEKHNPDQYSYNQMSIKYLLIATNSIEAEEHCEAKVMWKRRAAALERSGLDVNSCLQFLLEFYTQLLEKNSTPLRFLHEIVRSTVIISDLFTEKSQFIWMLDVFQKELAKLHVSVEDELLHQYLIVGICKAAAVLTPDLETYENIKKMLVLHLKSTFLPSRTACLHGLLYILEGCILSNISIGGISDEMQLILPCAVEYIQCNLNPTNDVLKRSQEHTLLVWSLAFYLMENVQDVHMESNFVTNTIQAAFGVLLQQKPNSTLHLALMKGLERLVIVKRKLTGRISKQIVSLALEKLRSDNPCVSISGKQLLLTYMYTDCAEHLEASAGNSANQTNPDYLVQTIEKIAAIFEHIKKGYGFEVEILCWVLPDILNDFFSPSDILTKVIGEFLSPQQPHPKLLSRVVFQVFQRAIEQQQQSLLQDWVVFSLSNITQSLSVGMATWCLTCFFISASSNEWLRLFFPYVQTRVGRYEYEDRKMLCIAGSDFYKNLTNEVQKKTFIENFSKIKDQPDKLFNNLLYSL